MPEWMIFFFFCIFEHLEPTIKTKVIFQFEKKNSMSSDIYSNYTGNSCFDSILYSYLEL